MLHCFVLALGSANQLVRFRVELTGSAKARSPVWEAVTVRHEPTTSHA
jgi:hypothetical protein